MHMLRGFLALLCLSSMLLAVAAVGSGDVIIVDDDWAKADYDNIQGAIDNATDGDWIYVFAGNYHENVIVNKSVTIYGNGTTETAVEVVGTVFDVSANATISHISVQDGDFGILCTAPDIRLRDLEFPTITQTAIDITGAETALMNKIDITNGVRGVSVKGSTNVTVRNSSVLGVSLFSMYIYESEDVTIEDVMVTGSTYGIDLAKETNDTIVRRAQIYSASNGIMLKDNINVTIEDSLIQDCTDGIPITEGFDVTIDNVTIEGATDGITVSEGTVDIVNSSLVDSVQRHMETYMATLTIMDTTFYRCDGTFASIYFRNSSSDIYDIGLNESEDGIGYEASWGNITNSTIDVTEMDMELIDSSEVNSYNLTHNNHSVDSTSTFTMYNYLWLYAKNSEGPIEGVDGVVIEDGSKIYSTEVYNGTDDKTRSTGIIGGVIVKYMTRSMGGMTLHDIDAGMTLGPWSEMRDLNMQLSRQETFTRPYAMDIYVDDDANGSMNGSMDHPYDTVMKGHDNAAEGDTIHVLNGTYDGGTISKALTLNGSINTRIELLELMEDGIHVEWVENERMVIDSVSSVSNSTIGVFDSVSIPGSASLYMIDIEGDLDITGTAEFMDTSLIGADLSVGGHVNWTGGEIRNTDGFDITGSANFDDVSFRGGSQYNLTFADVMVEGCNFVDVPSGFMVVFSNLTIEDSNMTGGFNSAQVYFSSHVVVIDSGLEGDAWLGDSTLEITGSVLSDDLKVSFGTLVMRDSDIGNLWMDGESIDMTTLDFNETVTVNGGSIGYYMNATDDIDASEHGYLALINSSNLAIMNATDINILIVGSEGIDIEGASLSMAWCELQAHESDIDISDSIIEDIELMDTTFWIEHSSIDDYFALRDSMGTGFNVSFGRLDLSGSYLLTYNSTWDWATIHDYSWITEMMYFQVMVTDDTLASNPVGDAEIEVLNTISDTVMHASPGYGGTGARTDTKGKSPWIIMPGVVHNITGTHNQTYNVSVKDRASEQVKQTVGPGPVLRISFMLLAQQPTIELIDKNVDMGLVWFNVTIADANWDPVSVYVGWHIDNSTYGPCTILNDTDDLPVDATGVNYTFVWDSLNDVPEFSGTLYVWFLPSDQSVDGYSLGTLVTLNNSDLPHPPTVDLLTPPDDAVINSTTVLFAWQSYDPDGDAYSNRLLLYHNGTEVWQVHQHNSSATFIYNLTENITYQWWVEIGDGRFEVPSEKRNFTIDLSAVDRNPPAIVHEPVTSAEAGVDVNITVYVYDDIGIDNVTLYYGKGSSWKTLPMYGGILFKATIPASDVSDDFSYYMIASDGRNSVTDPVGDPYEVDVLTPDDTDAPWISHVPEVNWTHGEPLTISAVVGDDRFVQYVELRYEDPRYPFSFAGIEMDRTSGDHLSGTYSAVIPGYAVVPPGVNYWIVATDGINNGSKGSELLPLTATVVTRDRILMINSSFTDGYIVVWASIQGPGELDVGPTADPSGGDRTDIGLYFTIEIDDPDANVSWVSIEVHYGDLPSGVSAKKLRMFYWDAEDEDWRIAGLTGVDIENDFVWANVTHLTIFAPLELQGEKDESSLVPFLMIAVLVIVVIFLAVVYIRHKSAFKKIRARANKVTCPRCRSEVEDNVSHRCPECGALLPKGSQDDAWEKTKDGDSEDEVEDDGKGLKPLPPIPGSEPDDVGPDFPMGVPRKPDEGPDIKDFEDAGHVERYGSMRAPDKDEKAVPGARPGPERKEDLDGLRDESKSVDSPEWEDDGDEQDEVSAEDDSDDPEATPEWEGSKADGDDPGETPAGPGDEGAPTPEWEEGVEKQEKEDPERKEKQ